MGIEFPADIRELRRHAAVHASVRVISKDMRKVSEHEVLAQRCSSRHMHARGCILEVRPPMATPLALKRGDEVALRLVHELAEPVIVGGDVGWVRPKVFLPDGLAVSCVGVDFQVVEPARVASLERFVEALVPPPWSVTFTSSAEVRREFEQNLRVGGVFVPASGDMPAPLSRTRVRLVLPAEMTSSGRPGFLDVHVEVVFAGPTGWGGQLVPTLTESQRALLAGKSG